MKRIVCVILIAVMALMFTGCNYNHSSDERMQNDDRMTIIYNDGFAVIYRDNNTGVQYFSRSGMGTCVMLNPDGTPYTGEWEGNK